LNSLVVGGNKGYAWLTSFMGLLHTISYTKIVAKSELRMTQYRIKLLTILANLIATHMI